MDDRRNDFCEGMNALGDRRNDFRDGMNSLDDRRNAFREGMNALDDRRNDFRDGMNALDDRRNAFRDKMNSLDDRRNAFSVIECNILWYNQYQNRIFLKYVANSLSFLAKALLRYGNNLKRLKEKNDFLANKVTRFSKK